MDVEEVVKPEPPPKPKPSSLVPGEIRQLGSGVTTISPGKCVARIRADQQQTVSLEFDERGFSSLSSSREASARARASPKPNVKSEPIEKFTSPSQHSNFLRPRSALVTPTRSAVSRRAIMRVGSPTSPLGGSANRTAMTMGLSLNSMDGQSRHPVGEVEARLICEESLGVACAFDDLDNDMDDFSQSSSDILAWNPETNSSAYK